MYYIHNYTQKNPNKLASQSAACADVYFLFAPQLLLCFFLFRSYREDMGAMRMHLTQHYCYVMYIYRTLLCSSLSLYLYRMDDVL